MLTPNLPLTRLPVSCFRCPPVTVKKGSLGKEGHPSCAKCPFQSPRYWVGTKGSGLVKASSRSAACERVQPRYQSSGSRQSLGWCLVPAPSPAHLSTGEGGSHCQPLFVVLTTPWSRMEKEHGGMTGKVLDNWDGLRLSQKKVQIRI